MIYCPSATNIFDVVMAIIVLVFEVGFLVFFAKKLLDFLFK